MILKRPVIERRILSALNATPSRIPVLLGGCGSGRTSLLLRVAEILGEDSSQYLDIERAASTPEGFCSSVTRESPYRLVPTNEGIHPDELGRDAKSAFARLLRFLDQAQSSDGHVPVFLIDELLELRAFESFPGLRRIQREVIEALETSPNRFVVSTRYTNRAHRLLRDVGERFEVIHVPPLSAAEVSELLLDYGIGQDEAERLDLGRIVHVLTDGRPSYVETLSQALRSMDGASSGDPVSALSSQLAVGSHLTLLCRVSYELRLHRARGYGALKAILHVLSEEEPLTLTEIAQRLGRTPGSTKDYLTWLQDVDLITVRQKRYSFTDPLLRLWVRLHCCPEVPDEIDLSREVQEYAVTRLPLMDSPTTEGSVKSNEKTADENQEPTDDRDWSLIEID